MVGIAVGITKNEACMKRLNTDYPGVYFIMGISKTSNTPERIYYINYRRAGKRIEEKAGRQFQDNMTPAKANNIRSLRIEGKQISNSEKRKRDTNINIVKNKWTLNKLWNEFYYNKSEAGLKSLYIDEYRYNKYYAEKFGELEPKEIKTQSLDKLKINISKSLKPETVRQILTLIQRIINFGIKKQLITHVNFIIDKPKVNNQKTEMLNQNQLEKLLEILDTEPNQTIANIMKMALFTGCRKSEILSLKWDDVDFDNSFIYLRDPKSGRDEKIPLNSTARKIIESQRFAKSQYVFPGPKGERYLDIRHTVNCIKKKADLPDDFRPLHGLRHVYASMLASSGQVDMYTLQKLLTHKSPQMTQRYAHLRDETLKKASELIGELIKKP